jgi:hypothetical protein
MASVGCRFFMLHSEAVELLQSLVNRLEVPLYHQLHVGGGLLEPVVDISSVPAIAASDDEPPVLFHVTHQVLAPGSRPGTLEAPKAGCTTLWLPYQDSTSLSLGSAGARIEPGREADAAVARSVVRAFRKAAPRARLVARLRTTGATGPASDVGCSESVLALVKDGKLELRQWGVANVEYLLPDPLAS